jgi:hypothetical protein
MMIHILVPGLVNHDIEPACSLALAEGKVLSVLGGCSLSCLILTLPLMQSPLLLLLLLPEMMRALRIVWRRRRSCHSFI